MNLIGKRLSLFLPALLLAATLAMGSPPPPGIAPARALAPHTAALTTSLRSLCLDSADVHSETAESLKVALMLALNPETPNLESLVGGAWPYEWEGMECELGSVTGIGANDIVARLYHEGRERSITLYLFEWSGTEPRVHELPASELGIHNALFLLGDESVLELFASLTDTTTNPFPVLLDLDGDGQQEVILHGLTEGFPDEGEEGMLYWPAVYRWNRGELERADSSFAGFYFDFVLPLYGGVIEELRAEWKAAGRPGDHPTAARLDSLEALKEQQEAGK